MRRVSPEVERLMWLIAEERDPRAIADFEARFPELKNELSKHMSMVSRLKTAGRKVPPHDIPRFVPRYAAPQPARNKGLYIALAFAVCALAFGSYSAVSYFSRPPLTAHVPNVNTNPPIDPYIAPLPTNPKTMPVPPTTGSPGSTSPVMPTDPDAAPPSDVDPLDKPLTLSVEHAPLEAAIQLVCMKAGLRYDAAPGMPQVEVSLNYQDVSARAIFTDLGRRYGFTAFPQERGQLLVIPARPDGEAPLPSTDGPQPKTGHADETH